MFQVLLMHTPKMIKTMPPRRKFQFLFAQTWYPFWSISYLVMFMSPIIALYFNRDIASGNPANMLIHFLPAYLCTYLIWWAARPIMQPKGLRLSWRGIILHAVRWPIILRAIIAALFKIKKPYMITPKGTFAREAPSLATYSPFLLFGLLSTASVVFSLAINGARVPAAQIIYSTINAIFMLTICAIDIALRLKNTRPKFVDFKKYWLKPALGTFALAVALGFSILTSSITINHAIAAAEDSEKTVVEVKKVNYGMNTEELIRQLKLVTKQNGPQPDFGMYNSSSAAEQNNKSYIQHSFVDWRDDHYFAFTLAQTAQNNNTPLITIEPRGEDDGAKLLSDISDGKYDQQLDKLISVSKASNNTIYIRFAHEMELANLYPWGNQSPQLYINAYRHTIDRFQSQGANNVKFVWSPAGNYGAGDYYPGDKYVDAIGTTVLYDEYWYGSNLPSFESLSESRQWLHQYNKPVWIVEFGAGRTNRINQQRLIDDAASQYQRLGFKELIYLNMTDANINGPDYRLDSANDFSSKFITQ
jgi:hypothetical protein